MPQPIFVDRPEPLIHTNEEFIIDIGDKKINDRFRVILNYIVVEKTKSYVLLKITGMSLMPSKRLIT